MPATPVTASTHYRLHIDDLYVTLITRLWPDKKRAKLAQGQNPSMNRPAGWHDKHSIKINTVPSTMRNGITQAEQAALRLLSDAPDGLNEYNLVVRHSVPGNVLVKLVDAGLIHPVDETLAKPLGFTVTRFFITEQGRALLG
jgi:hypothetical protein